MMVIEILSLAFILIGLVCSNLVTKMLYGQDFFSLLYNTLIVNVVQVPFQYSVHPPEHPDLPQHVAGHLHEHHQQLHGTGGC